MSHVGLAYAQEVYAACATVGYESDQVRQLKQMLDQASGQNTDSTVMTIVALAQEVQFLSTKWVRR